MNAKSIFSSVTFWGVVVSLVAKLLLAFGWLELDNETQDELVNMLALYAPLALGFVGDAVAVWGRINATAWIKPNALMKPQVKAQVRREVPGV